MFGKCNTISDNLSWGCRNGNLLKSNKEQDRATNVNLNSDIILIQVGKYCTVGVLVVTELFLNIPSNHTKTNLVTLGLESNATLLL